MLRLGQAGVATTAAVMALVAVAGGAVGAPVAVDSFADQQPGDPLYGLERAGESIKEATFAGGQNWQLDRAQERLGEFVKSKKRNVSSNHERLLNEAQERLRKGIKKSDGPQDLERAQEAVRKHIRVLENVENKVPEQAKPAIQRAMVRSRVREKALAEVQDNVRSGFGQGELPPGLLENKLKSAENIIKTLQDRELPPGIFKGILENREVPFDNLKDLIENRELSPGIVKEILENRDVSLDQIEDFLEGKDLPRGIVKSILKDKGMSMESIRDFLDELDIPGNVPENIGPGENAGPPENIPGENAGPPENIPGENAGPPENIPGENAGPPEEAGPPGEGS